MVIDAVGASQIALRLRDFTVTLEPYEWLSGGTTVHIYVDYAGDEQPQLFDGVRRPEDRLDFGGHLILVQGVAAGLDRDPPADAHGKGG